MNSVYPLGLSIQVTNQIKPLRHALGWNLDELSLRSGVSRATIGRIENGNSIPRLDTAIMIAHALELPINKVFKIRRNA